MSKTILVVDDSSSMRQVLKTTLTGAGHTVIEAADGKIALGLLDGRTIHMTICDLNMPNMNGIEFIRAAKTLPAYKYMPVLMLTTDNDDSKKAQGKEAGAKAWMLKPFSGAQLLSAVTKLSV
ncbi:two-component system response regulator [Rhodoferax lacus]|uniref:Two-component system response regulator n=1 Tax=Rhodoferax lacus TaxID=2184758 RepID=A0A3E1RF50_9BURK|nr:response regulator [Rhodoferax lacus]RFO97662.1 two-component system response regulator [Rhodoferax lacus]